MKHLSWIVPLSLVVGYIAYGAADVVSVVAPLPNSDFWDAAWKYIRSINSVHVAIVGAVALATTFFHTKMGEDLAGIWTLAALYSLSAVAFLVDGLISGTSIISIVSNSVFTAAVLNSVNEIIKHVFQKPVPPSA